MKKMAVPRGFYSGYLGRVHQETVSLALINAAKVDVIPKGSEVCVVCSNNGACSHYKGGSTPDVCTSPDARINMAEFKRISMQTLERRQENFDRRQGDRRRQIAAQ